MTRQTRLTRRVNPESPILRVDFDRRFKLEFHGSKVTSDVGLLVYRELDDALGLTEMARDVFRDNRTGKNGWHCMTEHVGVEGEGKLCGLADA